MRLPHFLLVLVIFCFLFVPEMQAQYVLQGKIADRKGNAISFATAVLQNINDSSIAAAELADSTGRFKVIANKIKGTFIAVSAQGYIATYKTIPDTSSKNIFLGLTLNE